MKALLALSMFLSFNAGAASLWVGGTEVTAKNVKKANVDMYNFARQPSKNFCYEGKAAEVIEIVKSILEIGTGDSDIIDQDVQVAANKSIVVKFNWYDEGGSHRTRKVVARCE